MRVSIKKKYLFFREDAKTILQEILAAKEESHNVYLDFSKVAFFSRSFVDELLNVISELKSRGISVTVSNLDLRLAKMVGRIQKTKTEIQKAMA